MGTFAVAPALESIDPGLLFCFCFYMWEICFSFFQRKSNYFTTGLTWRLLWNASFLQVQRNIIKFSFLESLTMILIHILQLGKGARTRFWEVSSIKIWKLILRTSCSRMRHWLQWRRCHPQGIRGDRVKFLCLYSEVDHPMLNRIISDFTFFPTFWQQIP